MSVDRERVESQADTDVRGRDPHWMTRETDGSSRRAENRNDAEERVALGLASERWAEVYEPITVLAFADDGAPMRWRWRGSTHKVYRVLTHEPGVWRVHSTGGDVTVSITADGFAVTQVRSVPRPERTEFDA